MKRTNSSEPDTLLDTLSQALRPLPFWIGYKRERYGRHPLPELAVGAELRELLQASAPRPWQVECEVDYRKLAGTGSSQSKNDGRPAQADVAIRDSDEGHYLAAIEIKRWHGGHAKVREDLDKLAKLMPAHKELRRFVVVVCESARPTKFITKSGRANRQWKQDLKGAKSASVRRVFRAIGHVPVESASKTPDRTRMRKSQHWVVLVEVS